MTNEGIPSEYTPCERYGSYIIAIRNGVYRAFTNHLGKEVAMVGGSTRAEVRRQLDDRMVAAGNKAITSGSFPMEDGSDFVWMLQGSSIPEITGWVERDHSIVKETYGFWRTPDPDEACRLCCDFFNLKRKEG